MRHIVEGSLAPDPSSAIAAATEAVQDVRSALKSIETAANGVSEVTGKAKNLDEFLATFRDMGTKVGRLADRADQILGENASELGPTIKSVRAAVESFNNTFDAPTQANLKVSAKEIAETSARLNKLLADIGPLAADLSADPKHVPTTAVGQTMARVGRVVYDIQLLAATLNDGKGHLNPNGSLQRLLMQPDLYNNMNQLSENANRVLVIAERALTNFGRFAERIANDPSIISRGALAR
jgi:phospholipid/cholesterol/gamma-HCH transport system substrate-binding protein